MIFTILTLFIGIGIVQLLLGLLDIAIGGTIALMFFMMQFSLAVCVYVISKRREETESGIANDMNIDTIAIKTKTTNSNHSNSISSIRANFNSNSSGSLNFSEKSEIIDRLESIGDSTIQLQEEIFSQLRQQLSLSMRSGSNDPVVAYNLPNYQNYNFNNVNIDHDEKESYANGNNYNIYANESKGDRDRDEDGNCNIDHDIDDQKQSEIELVFESVPTKTDSNSNWKIENLCMGMKAS